MRLAPLGILDAHVHFWDPSALRYPWLGGLPALDRPFLPAAYASATSGIPIDGMILVEANCLPHETLGEVAFFEQVAAADSRVAGIVAANPWARSAATLAATQLKHYYVARLLQPEFWRKLLRGGLRWTDSWR